MKKLSTFGFAAISFVSACGGSVESDPAHQDDPGTAGSASVMVNDGQDVSTDAEQPISEPVKKAQNTGGQPGATAVVAGRASVPPTGGRTTIALTGGRVPITFTGGSSVVALTGGSSSVTGGRASTGGSSAIAATGGSKPTGTAGAAGKAVYPSTGGLNVAAGGSSGNGGSVAATGGSAGVGDMQSAAKLDVSFTGPTSGTVYGGIIEQIMFTARFTAHSELEVEQLPIVISCDGGAAVKGSKGTPYFTSFEVKSPQQVVYMGPNELPAGTPNGATSADIDFRDPFTLSSGSTDLVVMMQITGSEDVWGELFGKKCRLTLKSMVGAVKDAATGAYLGESEINGNADIAGNAMTVMPTLSVKLSSKTVSASISPNEQVPTSKEVEEYEFVNNSGDDIAVTSLKLGQLESKGEGADYAFCEFASDGWSGLAVAPVPGTSLLGIPISIASEPGVIAVPAHSTVPFHVKARVTTPDPTLVAPEWFTPRLRLTEVKARWLNSQQALPQSMSIDPSEPDCAPVLQTRTTLYASGTVSIGSKNVHMATVEFTANDCQDIKVRNAEFVVGSTEGTDSALFCGSADCTSGMYFRDITLRSNAGGAVLMGPDQFQKSPDEASVMTFDGWLRAWMHGSFIVPRGWTVQTDVVLDISTDAPIGKSYVVRVNAIGADAVASGNLASAVFLEVPMSTVVTAP